MSQTKIHRDSCSGTSVDRGGGIMTNKNHVSNEQSIQLQPARNEKDLVRMQSIQEEKKDRIQMTGLPVISPVIQCADIPYRSITWADFQTDMDENDKHDAKVYSGMKSKMRKNGIKWAWNYTGKTKEGSKEIKITISYNRSKISMKPYMRQEESEKKKWLTDDTKAKEKFGNNVSAKKINKERSDLLKHEQIHFKISKQMAKVYEPKVKAVVPKTAFTAKKWVADKDEANEEGKSLFETKSQELDDAIGKVRDLAGEDLKNVQKIYDEETDHSKKTAAQKLWSGKFEKSFKKARKPKVTK